MAGGFGTRFSEETDIRPKPMIEIGNMPVLWHIMKIYSHYGFNDFVILLGYRGYSIKEYFLNYYVHRNDITVNLKNGKTEILNNNCEPWSITLIDTGLNTMTASRIKLAQGFIGNEQFMLTYGDGVGDINITDLLAFHESHGKTMTISTIQPKGDYGALSIDNQNRVQSFYEKPLGDGKDGGWINIGFFVCKPEIFDYLGEGNSSILEQGPLQALSRENELYAYRHRGFWKSMDTLKQKKDLNDIWDSGNAPWKIWK